MKIGAGRGMEGRWIVAAVQLVKVRVLVVRLLWVMDLQVGYVFDGLREMCMADYRVWGVADQHVGGEVVFGRHF